MISTHKVSAESQAESQGSDPVRLSWTIRDSHKRVTLHWRVTADPYLRVKDSRFPDGLQTLISESVDSAQTLCAGLSAGGDIGWFLHLLMSYEFPSMTRSHLMLELSKLPLLVGNCGPL